MERDNDSNGLAARKYDITQDDNDKYRIFNGDGYLRDAELKVMNFKPWGCKSNTIKGKCWEDWQFLGQIWGESFYFSTHFWPKGAIL